MQLTNKKREEFSFIAGCHKCSYNRITTNIFRLIEMFNQSIYPYPVFVSPTNYYHENNNNNPINATGRFVFVWKERLIC